MKPRLKPQDHFDPLGPDTRDRFGMIEDAYDGDLDFDKIPEGKRLHPNKYVCAVLKVSSLLHNPNNLVMQGEKDKLYFNQLDDFKPFADDDIIYLLRCGVLVHDKRLHIFTEGANIP